MSSITYSTPGYAGSVPAVRTTSRSFSSYANIAATVLMVVGLAAGGWFAAMQLNNPGSPDPRFAAMTGTPVAEGAVCDVEPLTVDEVMAMVGNPFSILPDSAVSTPQPGSDGSQVNEGLYMAETQFPDNRRGMQVNEDDFEAAKAVLDAYLPCAYNGTLGQQWALTDPVVVQNSILSQFQVYRSEPEVRSWVEERIDEPAFPQQGYWQSEGGYVLANPDIADASAFAGSPTYFLGDSRTLIIGESHYFADGSLNYSTDAQANVVEGNASGSDGFSYYVTYWPGNDTWYVFAAHTPRG